MAYIRFVSPWPSDIRAVDYGIFQAVIRCRDETLLDGYLLNPLINHFEWFKQKLPSPHESYFEFAGHALGICWFRDDAKTMIRHARHMAALMAQGDIWITEIVSNNPGMILYEDEFQIIAKPNKKTPTQWGSNH